MKRARTGARGCVGAGWRRALLACIGVAFLGATAAETVRVELAPGMVVALSEGNVLQLEALPEPGEGLYSFCRRLTGGAEATDAIVEANGGKRVLHAGVRYRVPYEVLRPELQVRALRALFADDRLEQAGWRHQVREPGKVSQESLWHLALWFTGRGEHFRLLRERNGLASEDLVPGQSVLIPRDLLLPAFRLADPEPVAEPVIAEERPDPAAGMAAASVEAGTGYRLSYGEDEGGLHAVYRLRAGEALYSSVVVRFTGRLYAPDVNSLAEEIAARSGIADVTDIPVGYQVKIPIDLLLPEHLPAGHPRRREYEAALEASARFGNRVRALDLSGITVILDAGHGGRDVGASFSGVWESLYVYDVMLRVRHLLESYTDARVLVTVQDGDRTLPEDRDALSFSRGHRVLTTPPYSIEVAAVATNLRWYLANSLYRREVARSVPAEKLVFLSIHADSLHPSLRGAMAYIPDARLRQGSFGRNGPEYAGRREWRERPRVSFSWQDRVQSEGLSRDLANEVIAAFRRRGLPVHPFKPVREKIIRRRSEYVPAVLRYNEVPAKILLEVCNLANTEDRKLLQTRRYRQQLAEAVVEGLLAYYGYSDQLPATQVAAGAR